MNVARKLYVFEVDAHDGYDFIRMGSVILPDNATEEETEHALVAVGVYAPRGMDRLQWLDDQEAPFAYVYDAEGTLIVRMWSRT